MAFPHAGHATPYDASLHGAPPSVAHYVAPPHTGHAASYGPATYNAPYGVVPQGVAAYGTASIAPPALTQIWAPSLSTEWVFNSGATAHLSKDLGIIYSLSPYTVHRYVNVGDGFFVPVSFTGHASLPLFYLITHFIFTMFLLHLA
jgi:hypothetical protein